MLVAALREAPFVSRRWLFPAAAAFRNEGAFRGGRWECEDVVMLLVVAAAPEGSASGSGARGCSSRGP